MRSLISAVVATVLVSCLASAADAKILTYCSEAAPEGFDPAPYISSATFDASSQVFYNRLVEFEPGTTNVVPGLAESWDVSEEKGPTKRILQSEKSREHTRESMEKTLAKIAQLVE